MFKNFEKRIRVLYEWLNERTNGAVRVVRIAIHRFGESNATQAAAGMAYYAFFSLFPLLLFLVVGASYILEIQSTYDYVMDYVFNVLPTARSIIDANIQQVLDSRGAVGLLGVAGFLWSSSGFFSVLARNINRAHPNYAPRNFLEDRALALIMIALLATLLGLSLLSNTITSFLPSLDIFYWQGKPLHETIVWRYIIKIIPFLITLVLLIGLYRYIPKKRTGWTGVLYASPLAAISWQLATKLFTWLLQEGFVRYELVYGSLGAVVGLIFWIHLISLITIFGAHLSAVIEMKLDKS
jgi:membrane protein